MSASPTVREEWTCCDRGWLKFGELLVHCDQIHKAIRTEGRWHCPRCVEEFPTEGETLQHFIRNHVEYKLRCLRCMGGYLYLCGFIDHINECNFWSCEEHRERTLKERLDKQSRPFREPH